MIFDCSSITFGDIQKQNRSMNKYTLCKVHIFLRFHVLPLFFQIVRFYTIFKLSSCISLKLWFRYCVADSENGIKIWNSVGLVGESVNIMEIAVLECTKW